MGWGCVFQQALVLRPILSYIKKLIEAGTRLFPIQIHHDREKNKGWDKQLRIETNFSSLGKAKRSK